MEVGAIRGQWKGWGQLNARGPEKGGGSSGVEWRASQRAACGQ